MSKHESRRKLHVARLAKQIKKGDSADQKSESGLVEQYRIIRDDLVKLRDDLTRGYDMAKDAVEKKSLLSELLKLRGSI